jgi:flagellar motor switch/type III secretory pathway protein FliN
VSAGAPQVREWAPPALPGVPGDGALWNALTSHLGQPLPLRGIEATVVLAKPPRPDAFALTVRFGAGPEVVVVPVAFPFKATFAADLTVADLALLPEALRDALGEGIAGVLGSALPEHGLGPAEVVACGPLAEAAPVASLRWFRAALGAGPDAPVVDLGATASALAAIFGGGLPARPVWPGVKARLGREVFATLGRLALTVAELQTLAPGALLVMEEGFEPGEPRLRAENTLYRFQATPDGLACVRVEPAAPPGPRAGPSESMDIPQDEARRDQSPLGALDVTVDLDLGSITVPLAEIETWAVGAIVALQPPAVGEGVEVTLRANGRVVGTGDLVRVDDRVAVRIARLAL